MRKKNRTVIKLLFLLLFFLFAGIWLFTGRKAGVDENYSQKRVSIAEVTSELSFGVYEKENWDAFFSAYHSDSLTSDILKDLLKTLELTDYIELPGMTGRHTVTRDEWNLAYSQILDLLDMERSVQKKTVLILDTMEAKEGRVLITNEGDYYTTLPEAYFEKWNGYELYCEEENCLGIVGISDRELAVENAYLTEVSDGEIAFLYGGDFYRKEIGTTKQEAEEGVCDLVFSGGSLVSLRMKQEMIQGALLSYDDTSIEIENYGKIAHPGKIPVYQTYGEVTEKSLSDVILGNMQVEYVTGENQVCAILIRQPAEICNIRVLLLAEDGGNTRESVYLTCDTSAVMKCGDWEEHIEAGKVIPASEFLAADPSRTLILTPEEGGQITICDANGVAASNGYAGSIEVRAREDGYTVVNDLPFETYLCAVVPSEMPSTYAPEALKAQAVCARSYAYIQLLRADLAEYGAHINDSTSYQVYNKVPATDASKTAVSETAGEVLTYDGSTVEAYYFSTSMGYTDTAAIWNVEDENAYGYLKKASLLLSQEETDLSDEEDFLSYIEAKPEAYDSDVKYYRWFASADFAGRTEELNAILMNRRAVSERNITFYKGNGGDELENPSASTVGELGKITGLTVEERSASGAILALRISYEKGSALVRTEYNIRKVLGACVQKIVYADSTESSDITMLPSAFCAIVKNDDGKLTLQGGGYGHGLGMSQNAANGMAKAGMNYEEILQYFYSDIKISVIE
ncbi:MAG: SpoIID/LytB domain-containing protein [Roseburia sp.]|nr:SpoIID/LytB domain-containing protein [Roseburia sp.]